MPEHAELVRNLRVLQEKGLIRLRSLNLLTLQLAAVASGESEQTEHDPPAFQALLRKAVEKLGGGEMGGAAEYLFWFVDGTHGCKPTDFRAHAARFYNLKADSFRKEPEQQLVGQVAEGIPQTLPRTTHAGYNV